MKNRQKLYKKLNAAEVALKQAAKLEAPAGLDYPCPDEISEALTAVGRAIDKVGFGGSDD